MSTTELNLNEANTLTSIKVTVENAIIKYRDLYKGKDTKELKHYCDLIETVIEEALDENLEYVSGELK